MAAGLGLACFQFAAAQEEPAQQVTAAAPLAVITSTADLTPCEQCNPVADASARPNFVLDPTPDAIMGFEGPNFWAVKINGTQTDSNVKSTTLRTQGIAAFEVINPASEITLTSLPISSKATTLGGIGKRGAQLKIDVRVQAGSSVARANAQDASDDSAGFTTNTSTNASTIEGFVTSKSRGLNKVSLGKVSFAKYRPGIYNTISFEIPESVTSALTEVSFNDLVFEFAVIAPSSIEGEYIFDNLRAHSVELTQSPKGEAPPTGVGGSIDLAITGNKPANHTFLLSPTQIPSSFHLKKGVVGKTTVQLELGLDSTPELTCTYVAASNSASEESYKLKSCSNGFIAGDLVQSNWMGIQLVNGSLSQQLHAQLALNPLGDLSGSGLIPPMPTYWGDSDGCTPAPVHGKVVTTSVSCAAQRTRANQILTDYFEDVKSVHPSAGWIAAQVPDSAVRIGNGEPLQLAPPNGPSANDIPFEIGGDLNPGGSFDAYWQLSGNLTPTAVTGTDENLTHFDATFTAHGVLFGDDVDVVDAKVTADTDSGETTPTYKPATSTGNLGFYVFGEEIPSGGLSFSPSTGFSVDPSWNQEYDLPSIQVWIFDITLGALVDADLKASGSAALSGADLSVVPTASLGGHISGGINLEVADGSVDAKVNLISLSAPVEAQVKWVLNTSPELCAATLNGSLKGDVTVGSGGGEVDLDATFGICPFCYTDSHTLFKWHSLVSKSWNLFNDTIDTQLFALPSKMCQDPITVSIAAPTSGASLTSGLPIVLTGIAKPNDPNVAYTSTYKWTYTPGANASSITINPAGANGPNPSVTFGAPPAGKIATWTIGLT